MYDISINPKKHYEYKLSSLIYNYNYLQIISFLD